MPDDTKSSEKMDLAELGRESESLSVHVDELVNEGTQIRTELNETLTQLDAALEDFRKEVEEGTDE